MTKPAKTDLRPTLPVAVKTKTKYGHTWVVNGVEHNHIFASNKYGESWSGEPLKLKPHQILAKYQAGKNWLVAVFLPCEHMYEYEQAVQAERSASISKAIEQYKS